MHDARAVRRYVFPDVVYDLVEVWVCAAELCAGRDVLDFGLLGFDAGEGVAVARVEACFLAESLEADGVRVDGMKPGEGRYQGEPGGAAFGWGEVFEVGVGYYAAFDELHYLIWLA